jgi:hypothetical protein
MSQDYDDEHHYSGDSFASDEETISSEVADVDAGETPARVARTWRSIEPGANLEGHAALQEIDQAIRNEMLGGASQARRLAESRDLDCFNRVDVIRMCAGKLIELWSTALKRSSSGTLAMC